MNKKIYSTILSVVLLLTSCSDFTDVQQKGMNLLSSTTELELLLNAEYSMNGKDERIMSGDMVYTYSNVATAISQPVKTRNVIMWTFDEGNQDRMAELTNSDTDYAEYYNVIGRICNPIMSLVDEADGSSETKRQLKAEALTLRAYFHFLAVNKFAKAYNPATAATDPGIIYMTEEKDIQVSQQKSTVQEVYDNILSDINEAIELDALPVNSINHMRVCKATAYAVKALALQNMQNFDEAEAAAKKSIESYGIIGNYFSSEYTGTANGYVTGGTYNVISKPKAGCSEDLFYVSNIELLSSINPEVWNNMEKGHAFHDRMTTDWTMYDYLMGGFSSMTGMDWTVTYDSNSGWNSCGIRTSQMYLVVAEAELHNNNVGEAMKYVDMVRVNRIDPTYYLPYEGNITNQSEAIEKYRRTSIDDNIYSMYNFINYKRWNQISGWERTYSRTLAGETYSIVPDSPMWIFPFPKNVTDNNSNITQNYKK